MDTDAAAPARKVHFMGAASVGNTACGRYVALGGFEYGRVIWTPDLAGVTCCSCLTRVRNA